MPSTTTTFEAFYVTIVRDGRKGWLLGPYETKAEAETNGARCGDDGLRG